MLSRIHKLHRALEKLIEALLCEAVVLDYRYPKPDGGVGFAYHVRWWNPAAWIGWSRTILFKDRCGRAYYRRRA